MGFLFRLIIGRYFHMMNGLRFNGITKKRFSINNEATYLPLFPFATISVCYYYYYNFIETFDRIESSAGVDGDVAIVGDKHNNLLIPND
jgi:hypothetical protein